MFMGDIRPKMALLSFRIQAPFLGTDRLAMTISFLKL